MVPLPDLNFKSSSLIKLTILSCDVPSFSVVLTFVWAVFGLGILFYRMLRRFFVSYLSTKGSIAAQTAIFAMQDINLNPSILNFLGIISFALGMAFIFFALRFVNKNLGEKENFFSVIFYSLIYILLRPIVVIVSLYKFFTGKYSWR